MAPEEGGRERLMKVQWTFIASSTEWGGSLEVTAILLNHIIESILIPGLDLDVVDAGGAEGADECSS